MQYVFDELYSQSSMKPANKNQVFSDKILNYFLVPIFKHNK